MPTKRINEDIPDLLRTARTIAVVGISEQPHRPSNWISHVLIEHGYEVYFVNPQMETWEGHPVYPTVEAVPAKIDIVDIFRRAEFVGEIVEDAIRAGAKTVWMQAGIVNGAAAERALGAGLNVVMDRCIAVELGGA